MHGTANKALRQAIPNETEAERETDKADPRRVLAYALVRRGWGTRGDTLPVAGMAPPFRLWLCAVCPVLPLATKS